MNDFSTIKIQRRLDCSDIDAAVISGSLVILQVGNEYDSGLPAGVELNVSEFSEDMVSAFKVVNDVYTWQFEALAYVWKVDFDEVGKIFTFSRSYLRDTVSTADETELSNGQPLVVWFEFPGFIENEVVQVEYLYNDFFSSEDVDLLADHGVVVSSVPKGFSFTNTRMCKVSFYKPDAVEGVYVIQYPALETVITSS